MYSKKINNSINIVPSDAQAKEKLAVYVYEYLHHVGATQSAQIFLSEIQWNKQITVGEKPGFLHSWWSVFWDLYSAAPERRDTHAHSPEAKMFHEYNCNINPGFVANGLHGPNPTPSPLGMPPSDGMAPGPAGMGPPPHGFFPPGVPGPHMRPSPPQQSVSQPSPHAMMSQSGFIQRYQGPRGAMRMSQEQPPYGASPGPPMYPDQMRNQLMVQQRLVSHNRMPQMSQSNFTMRPLVNASLGPGMGSGAHNMPRWQPSMQYGDPGPGQFPGPAMSLNNGPPPGPGTPIMRSPHNMPDGPSDRYGMMQPGGPPLGTFPMTSEQSGGVGGLVGEMLMNGDGLDMKNSPASSHGLNGTPGPAGPGPGGSQGQSNGPQGLNGPGPGGSVGGPNSAPPPVSQDSCSLDYGPGGGMHPFQTGSSAEQEAEIQKIKDSISEESKTFLSKDRPSSESGDFFNMH